MLLLFLGSVLIIRKVKYEKVKRLKQKFFNQNRGKLLQQLVSHRSDIAERMLIPLKELEKATNNFHRTRKLGGGGHGTVYKGILSDLHVVAIKKSNIVVKREINEFINEVAILSQINHRNIVKLIGCCLETEVPLLAYEFISNGTLCDYLHKEPRRSIPWEDRLRIATEIGKALAYLHSAISVPVIHRDIKSANILLDDALTTKVSDFGASRYIPKDQTCITTMVQGTLGYMDPTYYCSGCLTEKSDVYSFGVILIELLTRKMPITYRSSNGDGLVAQFLELLADCKLVEILDPQVMDEGGDQVEKVAALAMLCIKLRAEERPTMRQVEMTLEGLQSPKEHILHDLQAGTKVGTHLARIYSSTIGNISSVDVSRQYSQEEEFMLSARYPR
jgi:serine/threonine protein kinase